MSDYELEKAADADWRGVRATGLGQTGRYDRAGVPGGILRACSARLYAEALLPPDTSAASARSRASALQMRPVARAPSR